MEKAWPVMLVGNAGTGKSVLMGDKLESLNTDDYLVQAVPFNFYTTSAMLQGERAWPCPHTRLCPAPSPAPAPPSCGQRGVLRVINLTWIKGSIKVESDVRSCRLHP